MFNHKNQSKMTTKNLNNVLKILTVLIVIPLTLLILGCSSDDSDSDDNDDLNNQVLGCDQLISLSSSYSEAIMAFQTSPTEENCTEVKNSALDFIQALENCSQLAEQYQDLEEAAQEVTDLDCSEFN